jgi:DNA-binding CsgD family transcriptional regulator
MRDEWLRELTQLERALLERLSSGNTLVAAAAAEFLSLRTANRRVAAMRRRGGVKTTRELVDLYQQGPERA